MNFLTNFSSNIKESSSSCFKVFAVVNLNFPNGGYNAHLKEHKIVGNKLFLELIIDYPDPNSINTMGFVDKTTEFKHEYSLEFDEVILMGEIANSSLKKAS